MRAVTLVVALAGTVAFVAYWMFAQGRPTAPAWQADADEMRHISPLTAVDRYQLGRQRELADDLAQHHVGLSLRAQLLDLRTLQELIDLEVVTKQETYALQALGVAFGDVLVAEYPVTWVHVSDDYGETRALRIGDTDDVVFPVTMISRRIEGGIPVEVRALFDEVGGIVARSTRRALLQRGAR